MSFFLKKKKKNLIIFCFCSFAACLILDFRAMQCSAALLTLSGQEEE